MDRREFIGTAGLLLGSAGVVRAAAQGGNVKPAVKSLTAPSVCVAPDGRAAEAGAEMLGRGGNAFDAIVAAGFVEAVIAPAGSGIGGYAATGIAFDGRKQQVVAIDANAVAAAAATPGMFPVVTKPDSFDYKFPDSRHRRGPLSIAVPGVLGGLLHWLQQYGALERRIVMEPAIREARAGIVLVKEQARAWLAMRAEAKGNRPPPSDQVPEVVPMDDLAATLQAIAEQGADAFYSGRIGRAIVDHVRSRGGILTYDDFAKYRPLDVRPVAVDVYKHRVFAPPPASGGLTSLQMAALYELATAGGKVPAAGSPEAIELSLEIAKVVWAERLTTLGDPSAMQVEPQSLLEASHLEKLLALVRAGLEHPQPGKLIAPDPLRGTVHLAAADEMGNVVSWTQTHGGGFGSGVMVPDTGIVLGHGMCRFEPRPSWVNSIAPGKRPLHNMCPLLALQEGRPVLAVGAAGGRTIVNNSAALVIHRLVLGLSGTESVATPRVQCESIEPATVEGSVGEECLKSLRTRGHQIKVTAKDAGTAHLIAREGDHWLGVAESRAPRAGVAAGRAMVTSDGKSD